MGDNMTWPHPDSLPASAEKLTKLKSEFYHDLLQELLRTGRIPRQALRADVHACYSAWLHRRPEASQYPTPLPLSIFFNNFMRTQGLIDVTSKLRVLEPAAGSGVLLEPWANEIGRRQFEVIGYELDPIPLALASILFPAATWRLRSPELDIDELESSFDLVLCNSPWRASSFEGVTLLKERFSFATWSREQLFLALTIFALKPGGRALTLLPLETLSSLSGHFWGWLNQHCDWHYQLLCPPWSGKWQFELAATIWSKR